MKRSLCCLVASALTSVLSANGLELVSGGAYARVWAPFASSVRVVGDFNGWNLNANVLSSSANGWWEGGISGPEAGDQYKFVVVNSGVNWRPDPWAKEMVNSVGNSILMDPSDFAWTDQSFQIDNWNELVIYEMHLGTFPGGSPPNTFDQAIARLDHLVELGINAVELMPVNEFAGGLSWGYNPGHVFAVEESYGGMRGLQRFVNACHERGIAVLLDVVYNHLGPSDLGIWRFDGWSQGEWGGIYFYNDDRGATPWGDTRPDFGRNEVREYLVESAMYFLNDMHIDGLRVDGTAWIRRTGADLGGEDVQDNPDGWSWLQYLNNSVDGQSPEKIIVAEDGYSEWGMTRPTSQGGAGFDSQWDPNFHWPVRNAIEAANDDDRNMWAVHDAVNFAYNGDPVQRVLFTENHDEVANGRSRVPETIWPGNAGSYFSRKRSTLGGALVMTAPGVPMIFQGQEFLEDEYFRDSIALDWSKKETFQGVFELHRDLIALRRNLNGNSRGLTGPNINFFHVNNNDKLVGFHRFQDGGPGDDVLVVMNFRDQSWSNYRIGFPRSGEWKVIFNSDSTNYGEDYGNHPGYDITTDAIPYDGLGQSAEIGIGPYTCLIFSQVGNPPPPPPPPPGPPEDLNGDGMVGLFDVLIVLSNWGTGDVGDVNGDGAVEFNDLVAILAAWG